MNSIPILESRLTMHNKAFIISLMDSYKIEPMLMIDAGPISAKLRPLQWNFKTTSNYGKVELIMVVTQSSL
jgi:hypothetical protein